MKPKSFLDDRPIVLDEPYTALVLLAKGLNESNFHKLHEFLLGIWNEKKENKTENLSHIINSMSAYMRDIDNGYYKYGEGL